MAAPLARALTPSAAAAAALQHAALDLCERESLADAPGPPPAAAEVAADVKPPKRKKKKAAAADGTAALAALDCTATALQLALSDAVHVAELAPAKPQKAGGKADSAPRVAGVAALSLTHALAATLTRAVAACAGRNGEGITAEDLGAAWAAAPALLARALRRLAALQVAPPEADAMLASVGTLLCVASAVRGDAAAAAARADLACAALAYATRPGDETARGGDADGDADAPEVGRLADLLGGGVIPLAEALLAGEPALLERGSGGGAVLGECWQRHAYAWLPTALFTNPAQVRAGRAGTGALSCLRAPTRALPELALPALT